MRTLKALAALAAIAGMLTVAAIGGDTLLLGTLIPVDGTTFNDLTPIPVNGDPYYLFFSPDGNLLYIPCAGSTKLHVYNEPLARFESQDYELDYNITAPALSPEGDALMYIDPNMFLRAVY